MPYVVPIVVAINEFIYYCPQYFTTERKIFKLIYKFFKNPYPKTFTPRLKDLTI
jgi:hypothetical protein